MTPKNLDAKTFLRIITLVGKGNMPVYEVKMVRLVDKESKSHKKNKGIGEGGG